MSLPFLSSFKKKRSPGLLSLCVSPSNVIICFNPHPEQRNTQLSITSYPYKAGRFAAKLKTIVTKHEWQNTKTIVVLNTKDYRLLLNDRPIVSDNELVAATKWAVKDLIDMPITRAAVDLFEAPNNPHQKQKVFVVVTKMELIQQLHHDLSKAELIPAYIDIAELSLRNLVLDEGSTQNMGVLYGTPSNLMLMVITNKQIYLVRKLNTSFSEASCEDLILEIQRSLDFYQSQNQMSVMMPSEIWVAPSLLMTEKQIKAISTGLSIKTTPLIFADQAIDPIDWQSGFLAIGGALRLAIEPQLTNVEGDK